MKEAAHFYNQSDDARYGRPEMPEEKALVSDALARFLPDSADAKVVEIGCGMGPLCDVHPGYIGIDLSHYALKTHGNNRRAIQADAELLPLSNDTVDFLFSFATLEHVPYPEKAISEIERVMKPNGVAYLHPAWFCRKWAARALPIRSYKELPLQDKLEKLLMPVSEFMPLRLAMVIPRRVMREARYLIASKPAGFDYIRLNPNLSEYVYTDSDAWTHMDSHACIMYFHSRGWEILSAPTVFGRLTVRHEPVVVRKRPRRVSKAK